jgi:Leucine-rich repeat (LRR) protein
VAYSDKNLNRIAGQIIGAYKARDYDILRKIESIVSEFIEIEINPKINKCFSKLLKIYHPDKGNAYREHIQKLYQENKTDELNQFAHIFQVQNFESVAQECLIDEDIGYEPEYVWDYDQSGYGYYDDFGEETRQDNINPAEFWDNSFFGAVKRKIYGTSSVEMPAYYLEDLEEIDMADYEIDNLDGIEHCLHVKRLDLSGNQIVDLVSLARLNKIQELLLSDNQIFIIDELRFLKNLRILELSGNFVDDISPLFALENLEYVNLMGNPVPSFQIRQLESKGVSVGK